MCHPDRSECLQPIGEPKFLISFEVRKWGIFDFLRDYSIMAAAPLRAAQTSYSATCQSSISRCEVKTKSVKSFGIRSCRRATAGERFSRENFTISSGEVKWSSGSLTGVWDDKAFRASPLLQCLKSVTRAFFISSSTPGTRRLKTPQMKMKSKNPSKSSSSALITRKEHSGYFLFARLMKFSLMSTPVYFT